MMLLPPETPVTTPVPEITVATDAVPLVQLPDGSGSDKVMVEFWQTMGVPTIGDGSGFTVTTTVATQPVANV